MYLLNIFLLGIGFSQITAIDPRGKPFECNYKTYLFPLIFRIDKFCGYFVIS